MSEKIYIRASTPFSLKDWKVFPYILSIVCMAVLLAAVAVVLKIQKIDFAERFVVVAVVWPVFASVMFGLLLSGHVILEDQVLVVRQFGFGGQRYPRQKIRRAQLKAGRVCLYTAGEMIISVPDSEPARRLVNALGLPLDR